MRAVGKVNAAGRPWGVNVVGYLEAEIGVGEAARQMIGALDAREIPVMPIGRALTNSRSKHPFAHLPAPRQGPFAVNLVCENAVALPECAEVMGDGFFADRYTVGLWFWEVSSFPGEWQPAFDHLDELWVASDHVADAIRPVSPVPVHSVGLPVQPRPPLSATRAQLGLPEGFAFLFVFDFNSVMERKNPLGLIDAFGRAFGSAPQPTLVIKTINGERNPAQRDELAVLVEESPGVHLLDGFVSPSAKNALIEACDCYVSLHRSEGYGLTLAEAMYFGRPTIATGYSGNIAFMTPENSFLVDHELVPIGPGSEPYPADDSWAEPDLDHAAALMRQVFEDPNEAGAYARQGAADIRARLSREAIGRVLEDRLEEIIALPPRPPVTGHPVDAGPDLEELRWRTAAEPAPAPGQGAARGALRKLLLRLLRPYSVNRELHDRRMLEVVEELAQRDREAFERALQDVERLRTDSAADTAAVLAELRRLSEP
jgi:glycosyltransferase involved in cell wall biosynthesis